MWEFVGLCQNLKRRVVDGLYNADRLNLGKLHCLNWVIYLSSPYNIVIIAVELLYY